MLNQKANSHLQPPYSLYGRPYRLYGLPYSPIQLYTNIKFTHTALKYKEIHKYQFKATKSLGKTLSSVDCSALEAGAVSVLDFSENVLCSGINFFPDNMSPPSSLLCPVFLPTEHGLPGSCFGYPLKSWSPVGDVLPVPDFFDEVLVVTILHSKFSIKSSNNLLHNTQKI